MKPNKLIAILQNAGASEGVIKNALRELNAVKRVPGADWAKLLNTLSVDRRKVACNRGKWGVDMVSTFNAYLLVMDKARKKIEQAQLVYPTVADATRAAAAENAERERAGKEIGATCGTRWQTWVPKGVRQHLMGMFEIGYSHRKGFGGRRTVPFINSADRDRIANAQAHLQRTIKGVRALYRDAEFGTARTPYRALYLLACKQAADELDRILHGYKNGLVDPIDNPLPVNWRALLTPAMRTRLREADKNPKSVSTHGLGNHLYVDLEGQEHEDADKDIELSGRALTGWDDIEETFSFDSVGDEEKENADEMDTKPERTPEQQATADRVSETLRAAADAFGDE